MLWSKFSVVSDVPGQNVTAVNGFDEDERTYSVSESISVKKFESLLLLDKHNTSAGCI